MDAYWNDKWPKVTFPAADGRGHCRGLRSRQEDFLELHIPQEEAGGGSSAELREASSGLQTADEWQNSLQI